MNAGIKVVLLDILPRDLSPTAKKSERNKIAGDALAATVSRPEDVLGLLPPRGSLLGQGAGFVLGVAGLQGGLLGEQDRLHHGRRAAVVALEGGG